MLGSFPAGFFEVAVTVCAQDVLIFLVGGNHITDPEGKCDVMDWAWPENVK
jgi:hypothetical protein